MIHRHLPSEPVCPVPLPILAQLLRLEVNEAAHRISAIPARERAELAVFCFARTHMRGLGLRIAALCDEADLERSAGLVGQSLFEQANQSNRSAALFGDRSKRSVTLAKHA